MSFYSYNDGTIDVTSNKPPRGSKGLYYERGIRVPLAFCWPGRIDAGTTCDVPVTSIDFFPTFLELANAPDPDQDLKLKAPVSRWDDLVHWIDGRARATKV